MAKTKLHNKYHMDFSTFSSAKVEMHLGSCEAKLREHFIPTT